MTATKTRTPPAAKAKPSRTRASNDEDKRGRPPKKAFINVLVRTTTRSALNRIKAVTGLPSQGEVIDQVIADLLKKNPALDKSV